MTKIGESLDDTKVAFKVIKDLLDRFGGIDDIKEDTFIRERILPILNPTFPKKQNVSIAGSSTSSQSSKSERKTFDPSLQGKVPDYSVSFVNNNNKYEFFVMEVKPPGASNKDVDLLKTCRILKNSLDCLYKSGLDEIDLAVFGLIVEGYQYDLYSMDIKYDGLYRFYKIGTFYIPRSRHDFYSLFSILKYSLTLNHFFVEASKSYSDEWVRKRRQFVPT